MGHAEALSRTSGHAFHHLAHLFKLANQHIHLLNLNAGTPGDARSPAPVEDIGVVAFRRGHGIDDGLHLGHALFGQSSICGGKLFAQSAETRDQLQDTFQAAEFLHVAHLLAEIFEIEGRLLEFFGELFGFFLFDGVSGFLGEREDITHTEDAACDAVGMKNFQLGKLFAHADEFDRSAGNSFDGKSGTAAGIAVHLRENNARDAQFFIEGLCDVDGVLTGHGIGHEEDFLGVHGGLQVGKLLHEDFVHVQPAGRIKNHDRGLFCLCLLERLPCDVHGVHVDCGRVVGHAQFLGEDDQLIDGSGTVDVSGNEVGAHFVAPQIVGDFGC